MCCGLSTLSIGIRRLGQVRASAAPHVRNTNALKKSEASARPAHPKGAPIVSIYDQIDQVAPRLCAAYVDFLWP